jgi:hypothetical protein
MTEPQARMTINVGVTDDLKRVSLTLAKNGETLGWIELDQVGCQNVVHNIEKYAALLKPDKWDATLTVVPKPKGAS